MLCLVRTPHLFSVLTIIFTIALARYVCIIEKILEKDPSFFVHFVTSLFDPGKIRYANALNRACIVDPVIQAIRRSELDDCLSLGSPGEVLWD